MSDITFTKRNKDFVMSIDGQETVVSPGQIITFGDVGWAIYLTEVKSDRIIGVDSNSATTVFVTFRQMLSKKTDMPFVKALLKQTRIKIT